MAGDWDNFVYGPAKKDEKLTRESGGWDAFVTPPPPDKSSITGNQLSASIDRYQAGLYGVGEAVAGAVGAEDTSKWLAERRAENERQADIASERARAKGAVDQWKDVHGISDFGSYAKGLAIQSIPYAAEALAGGVLARGAMSGTRAALAAAEAAGDTAGVARAQRALNLGSGVGGVAASYPSAVGDVLSNQREQAGKTDLLAAAGLAVPYAALNAVGVEGALMKGSLFRNTVSLLDRPGGIGGALARTAATATGVGLKEGASETGQEMLNQLGRMSVDEKAQFFSEDAQERYKESFIGGATLGGFAGGAFGGWRRSTSDQPPSNEISDAIHQKTISSPPVTTGNIAPPAAPPVIDNVTAPLVSTPPAMAGGTTPVAQASQELTQAQFAEKQRQEQEQQQIQQALQQQATREQTFSNLGAVYNPEGTGELNVFGQPVLGHAQINQFGNLVTAQMSQLPPHAHAITDAIVQANNETGGGLVSFKYNGQPISGAKALMKAFANVATKFQIGHVASVEEAAANLEKLSTTVKGNQLDQLNAIYQALTGKDTPGYIAAQQSEAEKGAKNGKLQLQTTTGLGTVPVQGSTGEAGIGGNGPVRPTEVQPVGAAGLREGSLGLQTGQLPAGGVRTSAGADTDLRGGQPTPNTQVKPLDRETRARIQSGVALLDPDDRDLWALQLERKLEKNGALTWKDIPQELNNSVDTVAFAGIKEGIAANPKETIALIRGVQQEVTSEETQPTKPKAKLGVPVRVKAAGKQGAPSVQPTPAPAPKATQREEAKLSPAEELWNDMDDTDTPYASLTPALKQAWEHAVETKQTSGLLQEEIANQANDRAQETKSERLTAGILQLVIQPYGKLDAVAAQKKREFFQAFWGGAKLDTLPAIAKQMDISIDQARKWHAEMPKFFEKNGQKIIAAAMHVAEAQGMTMRDLEQLLEGIEAKKQSTAATAAQTTGVEEDTGQSTSATEEPVESDTTGEEEFGQEATDLIGERGEEGPSFEPEVGEEAEAAPDLNIRTRKSLSVQEKFNAVDTNQARIVRLMNYLESIAGAQDNDKSFPASRVKAAETKYENALLDLTQLGNEDLHVLAYDLTQKGQEGEASVFVEELQNRLEAQKKIAVEQAKKQTNKSTKEKPNAVQVESTDEGNVRQPAGGGEEVGQANAEPKKPTRARKAKVEAKPAEEVKEVKTDAEKASDAWDAVVKDIPGAPTFMALTDEERETFIEYGEDNWTRADVVAELKKLNAVQPVEAKQIVGTPEQQALAERVAKDVGGEVVWQDGDMAIVRCYAKYTGAPLYIASKKGAYPSRVSLKAYTGNIFTADEKSYLLGLIDKIEAEAERKHDTDPYLKFGPSGILMSANVPSRIAGVAAGWKNMLGIKVNVYVSTVADARADANKFTGPHRAIGSAGLDPNEAGSMRQMADGNYYITFTASTSQTKMLEVIAHELGHIHMRETFNNADAATQTEIKNAFEAWKAGTKGKSGKEVVLALRARATGRATGGVEGKTAEQLDDYWTSFKEWYADQVSRWATTSEKPLGVVEQFFAKLGAALKKFYYNLKSQKYLPTESMKKFLDRCAENAVIIDSKTAAQIDQSGESILAGVRSMNNMKGDAKDALKGRFATAKIMEAAGDSPMDIWKQTGWYKGVEGKWRYEIPDTNAKFVAGDWGKVPENEFLQLDAVLDHPALFNAIPSLKDIQVIRDPDMAPGEGSYSARSDVIRIGAIDPAMATGLKLTPLQILLHEVQHAVQEREGFAKGGSPEGVDPFDMASFEKLVWQRPVSTYQRAIMLLEPFVAQHQAVRDAEIKAAEYYANMGNNPTMDQVMRHNRLEETARRMRGSLEKAVETAWLPLGGKRFANSVRLELYEMIGGEVEANVVMRRQGKTAEELAAKVPESVKHENQLIYTGSETVARHISNLPPVLRKPVTQATTSLLDAAKDVGVNRAVDVKRFMLAAGITEDVVNGAAKYMKSAKDYLAAQYARQGTRIEHEKSIQRIEEAFERLPTALQGTGANSVNAFIYDSTTEKKWGYVPSYNPNVKPDADLKARFDAMPADAQAVIRMVFDHGYKSLQLKKQAVKAAADKEFSQREQDAAGDQEQLNNIAAERRAWTAKYDRLMGIKNDMPYAYLGRYGDYVAVAKSETFVDAEKLANQGDLDAAKWLEENQSDANHYIVEFAETQAEANNKAAVWKASGQYQHTYAAEKEVSEAYVGGSDLFMGITRLRNMITRRLKSGELSVADQDTLDALHKLTSDLYLATVAEASAHRTAMQRKNIAGADKDMMRNLATRGRADAHFLASLKHNSDVTDAISDMRDEAKADPANARPYLNELLKRYAKDINYKTPAPLAQALTRMGHTWFLSFNPAFYLQQMTQTYVLSLPYMAGRLGYHRSLRSINSAYKDVLSLVKGLNVNEHIDFEKAPLDVRSMLRRLVSMGKIDIGIDADAVVYANERTVMNNVTRKLNGVNNRIEAINRATAAIAAYRGYLQRYGANNTEAATQFAAETVSNTHGSYDGFNTPRILNSNVGRVIGQFKRFQIIQLSMLGKLLTTAFKGASAEERVIARRSLKYITTHMAVLGGALGVPFVTQLGNMLIKVFGADDEPDDLEYQLRQAIGDPALANLLLRGIPAYLGAESIGKKLAMENVASILPFTDVDLTSRSGAEKALVGLMGPTAALSLKFADALGMIGQGKLYKGMELALPSGFANAMKGYRIATEGVTMRNGDPVLSAEEISMVDAAFQAVGLPTNTITQRQYVQRVEKEFDKYYSDRAAEIKGAYVNASRDGDGPAMAQARDDWDALQDSRRKNGYTVQPKSELFKATIAAQKRVGSVIKGVETTKANKRFVEQII